MYPINLCSFVTENRQDLTRIRDEPAAGQVAQAVRQAGQVRQRAVHAESAAEPVPVRGEGAPPLHVHPAEGRGGKRFCGNVETYFCM